MMLTARAWPALGAAGLIALALAGTHWQAYRMGAQAVHTDWTAEKLAQAEQTRALVAEAAATTDKLQIEADTLRKTKNAQIARLNADLSIALAGLSDRPARDSASSLPAAAGAGANPGCTGASLWREDGEFLVRLSREADELAAALNQCYKQYNAARQK